MEQRIEKIIHEIIRVNYAGECGARDIYAAQINATKNAVARDALVRMLSEELVHLDYFENLGKNLQVRPSVLMPIWKIGAGFLGKVTAKFGISGAMACTVGVESAIQEHYKEQLVKLAELISELADSQEFKSILVDLKGNIEQFLADEARHHDMAVDEVGNGVSPSNEVIKYASYTISKLAIGIAKRL